MTATLTAPPRRKKIGLTALIDVVFILLLFFMLTSSFSRWKAVDLQAPVHSRQTSHNQPQIVILEASLAATFVGQSLQFDNILLARSEQLSQLDKTAPLVLVPKAEVSVQTIVSSLEHFKQLGWPQVSLGDVLPAAAGRQIPL